MSQQSREITWVRSGEELMEIKSSALRRQHAPELELARAAAGLALSKQFTAHPGLAAEMKKCLDESVSREGSVAYAYCLLRTEQRHMLWVDFGQRPTADDFGLLPIASLAWEATKVVGLDSGATKNVGSMSVEDYGVVQYDAFSATHEAGSLLVTQQYVFPMTGDDADAATWQSAASDCVRLLEVLTGAAAPMGMRCPVGWWRRADRVAAEGAPIPPLQKVIPAPERELALAVPQANARSAGLYVMLLGFLLAVVVIASLLFTNREKPRVTNDSVPGVGYERKFVFSDPATAKEDPKPKPAVGGRPGSPVPAPAPTTPVPVAPASPDGGEKRRAAALAALGVPEENGRRSQAVEALTGR